MTMVQCLSPWAILAPGWGKFFLLGFALSAEGVDRNYLSVFVTVSAQAALPCEGVDRNPETIYGGTVDAVAALSTGGVDRNLFEPVKSFLPLFLWRGGIKSEKSLQKSTNHVP